MQIIYNQGTMKKKLITLTLIFTVKYDTHNESNSSDYNNDNEDKNNGYSNRKEKQQQQQQ